MPERLIPNTGEYADLALGPDGLVYVCAETAAREAIVIYRSTQLLTRLPGDVVGGQVMALYPRIGINPFGEVVCIYQRGACIGISCLAGWTDIRPASEIPFGVEMVGIAWLPTSSCWRAAYVAQLQGAICVLTLDYGRTGAVLRTDLALTDTTQGISRILPDGTVVLVDADNIWPAYPNLSRPWQAGALVIGQGNDAPARAIGYLQGRPDAYRIFDGIAFRPRAIETQPNIWAAICVGDRIGVRVVDLPPFALDAPPIEPPKPIDPPVEPPKPIDPPVEPPIEPPITPPEGEDMGPYPDEGTTQNQTLQRVQKEYVIAKRIPEGGPPPDWSAFKWGHRIMYDYCAGMSYQASEDKHIRELQAELGNPVDPLPPS